MERRTVSVYEVGAEGYARRRRAYAPEDADAFAATVAEGALRLDLGCGPGHYTPLLGRPVVALDAASAMLHAVPDRAPNALRVRADLEALPLRRAALGGAWASKCYQHLPPERLPLALADLHRSLEVGAPVALTVFAGSGSFTTGDDDPFAGRYFALWDGDHLGELLAGAGFEDAVVQTDAVSEGGHLRPLRGTARRARTLPDTVGPGMRLLVCGLNPSIFAADAGVGYARPGNRFWPAALAAGIVEHDRDPWRALAVSGVGMTDLVKRASVGADELSEDEFRAGLARVERLCAWLRPRVVCLVGLGGWRAAVDRRAVAGPQARTVGGVATYVMPSTSGRNARTSVDELASHLAAAAALADAGPHGPGRERTAPPGGGAPFGTEERGRQGRSGGLLGA